MSDKDQPVPMVAASRPLCKECGGTSSRHYTDCTTWTGEELSARRLHDEFTMAALTGLLASGSAFDDRTIVAAFATADRCISIRASLQKTLASVSPQANHDPEDRA